MHNCEVFSQSLADLLAENYHNIWAKKKKGDLEAKGKYENSASSWYTVSFQSYHLAAFNFSSVTKHINVQLWKLIKLHV